MIARAVTSAIVILVLILGTSTTSGLREKIKDVEDSPLSLITRENSFDNTTFNNTTQNNALDSIFANSVSESSISENRLIGDPKETTSEQLVEPQPSSLRDIFKGKSPPGTGYIPERDAVKWINTGVALSNQGYYDEAIKAYDEAARLDRNNPFVYYNKGVALSNQGYYDEAIKAFDEAIKLDPNYAAAWNGKGVALSNQGMYDDAIKAFDKAIKPDPNYAFVYYNKGVALSNQGMYDDAIKAFDEAIKLDPNYAAAWNGKGVALSNQGMYDDAIKAYDEAARLDRNFANAEHNMSYSLDYSFEAMGRMYKSTSGNRFERDLGLRSASDRVRQTRMIATDLAGKKMVDPRGYEPDPKIKPNPMVESRPLYSSQSAIKASIAKVAVPSL